MKRWKKDAQASFFPIDQDNGTILAVKKGDSVLCDFPETAGDSIYSAPNIGILNPYNSTSRRLYRVNSDYDRIDLQTMPEDYLIRCRYRPGVEKSKYLERIPKSPWGRITDFYRLVSREFVGVDSERTLTWYVSLGVRQAFLMISLFVAYRVLWALRRCVPAHPLEYPGQKKDGLALRVQAAQKGPGF